MTLSEAIADFIDRTEYSKIPREVIEKAKLCILDTLGCILLGGRSPWTPVVKNYLLQVGGKEHAHVIGLPDKTSAPHAAFANGLLGHIYDLDDVYWGIGHPSIAVLPAALAVAETRRSSGKDFLAAFALGWEVVSHMSDFLNPWQRLEGWYPSATIGIFGAAAAASKVLKLNLEQTCWSLGLAACQSVGLMASFGTMAKPFTLGKVGLNGVMAAMMAEQGVNSARDIFEGRHGFLGAYIDCGEDKIEAMKSGLGRPWKMLEPGVLFKRYPSCTGTHPGIEAVLELRADHPFSPEEVDSIKILTDPAGPDMLKFSRPKNALEAQFSMHFCIALAIVEGDVTPEHFTSDKVKDPGLLSVMDLITMGVDPELAKKGYLSKSDTAVIMKLKDGREFSRRVKVARGDPERPFSPKEIEDKFLRCARKSISEKNALQCVEMIRNLEEVPLMGDLGDLLSVKEQ